MRLVVGLGNPGREYAGTRHNAGFEVVEVLSRRHGIDVRKRTLHSVIGDGSIGAERVLLARPMTYMNNSGTAVAALCRYYRLAPAETVIVLDDASLPAGRLRLRQKGSAGGHHGLADILARMGTDEVPRVRIGIGAPAAADWVDYVLSRFAPSETAVMSEAYERAADAVQCALEDGFEIAMTRFNRADETGERP